MSGGAIKVKVALAPQPQRSRFLRRPNAAENERQRKFLWPDAKRLDLDQSVRRINQQYPDFPKDKIEEFLIYWIQELYVPEGYSESQMDELERLTEQWAKDHERQSTKRRTRHS